MLRIHLLPLFMNSEAPMVESRKVIRKFAIIPCENTGIAGRSDMPSKLYPAMFIFSFADNIWLMVVI